MPIGGGVLAWGVYVMRRLSFSRKLALIGLLAAMPILVVLWSFFLGTEPQGAFTVVMGLCVADAVVLLYLLLALQVSVTQDIA